MSARWTVWVSLLGVLAIGCGESSSFADGGSDAGGGSSAGGDGVGAGAPSAAELYGCDEAEFGDVISLGGPGYDP